MSLAAAKRALGAPRALQAAHSESQGALLYVEVMLDPVRIVCCDLSLAPETRPDVAPRFQTVAFSAGLRARAPCMVGSQMPMITHAVPVAIHLVSGSPSQMAPMTIVLTGPIMPVCAATVATDALDRHHQHQHRRHGAGGRAWLRPRIAARADRLRPRARAQRESPPALAWSNEGS